MTWFEALFRPRAVAIIGSVSPGKIGRVLIDQLLEGGFRHIVAVNPKGMGVGDVPGIRSLGDTPSEIGEVDLAVIASPASTVADVLRDAGAAGIQAAVIITAGFSESGHTAEERALLQVAQQHGIRLIGPNCAGIVNTAYALFATLETRPPAGRVAFVSQSGALGGAVLSWAEEQGVGFSKFASYGNAVDLTESDFLDALRDDDETDVVALYIESVSDGRRFMEVARRLTAVKPLVVVKSGRSESGRRATQSHTGSLAGSDAVYEAALAQCGALRASGIEEMFDLCRGFVHLPDVRGRRLAIVTNSGGPGVLATDAAEAAGIDITPPSADLRHRLEGILPPFCSLANPFDLTVQGTREDYEATLIEALGEYDAALAINVNTPYLDVAPLAQGVVAAAHKTGKPIAASFVAGAPAQAARPVLADGGVPNFVTGERAVHVLAQMADYVHRRDERQPEGQAGSRWNAAQRVTDQLPWDRRPTEPEAMEWLEKLDLPVIDRAWAHTAEEAVRAAEAFAGPVAMKIVSPLVLHKTDVGGVALGLESPDEIADAFSQMKECVPADAFHGVLIAPMIEHPVEAIVGLSRDAQFGPVIAVGLGGIHTEIFGDVSLRVTPVSVDEAQQMIESLRGVDLLRGVRGNISRDLAALAQLVSDISRLPHQFEGIEELDLNPVFLLERGCAIGDVRIIPEGGSMDQRGTRA